MSLLWFSCSANAAVGIGAFLVGALVQLLSVAHCSWPPATQLSACVTEENSGTTAMHTRWELRLPAQARVAVALEYLDQEAMGARSVGFRLVRHQGMIWDMPCR